MPAEEWRPSSSMRHAGIEPFNALVAGVLAPPTACNQSDLARFYLDEQVEADDHEGRRAGSSSGVNLAMRRCTRPSPGERVAGQSDYKGMLALFSPRVGPGGVGEGIESLSFPETHGEEVAFDSVFVKDDHGVDGA